jgi:hypothetical protein
MNAGQARSVIDWSGDGRERQHRADAGGRGRGANPNLAYQNRWRKRWRPLETVGEHPTGPRKALEELQMPYRHAFSNAF